MMGSVTKQDFMMKRSVNKSRITAQNYKSRWFILDDNSLSYKDGTLEVIVAHKHFMYSCQQLNHYK